MVARYVFLDVKKKLLGAAGYRGIDVREKLEGCVVREKAIESEDDPLHFFDRMRACVGALEDGHLILSVPGRLPLVSLGVGLRMTQDGEVRIAYRPLALLEYLESGGGVPGASELLALGRKVVAIDGVPIANALDELGKLVPASSAGRASNARSTRSPAGTSPTHVKEGHGSRSPLTECIGTSFCPGGWRPGRTRTRTRHRGTVSQGYRRPNLIDWNSGASPGIDAKAGLSRTDPVLDPVAAGALRAYLGDAGQLAARLGEGTLLSGHRVCYAQLLTFHSESLTLHGKRSAYLDVMKEYLGGCEARKLDLVLDLRQNEGGYLSHSTALARFLLRAGARAPAGTLLLAGYGAQ